MVLYTPIYAVVEASGGNLKIVGPGASTKTLHVPHFPDERSASKPTQTHFGWDSAVLFLNFESAFPADDVVPSSALECTDSRSPPEGQRVILGSPGRFKLRNLVLKHCDHDLGPPRPSSVRSGKFSSSWVKYRPKIYASDYILRNRRR